MSAPYRRASGSARGSAESSPAVSRAARRSRFVRVGIVLATVVLAGVVLGADPGFSGCSAAAPFDP